jgi:hypothetical protein
VAVAVQQQVEEEVLTHHYMDNQVDQVAVVVVLILLLDVEEQVIPLQQVPLKALMVVVKVVLAKHQQVEEVQQ